MWSNYHQHCNFCDGTDEPELYVTAALEQGVGSFGFSSHATVPFDVPWCIKPERFDEYIARIQRIKAENSTRLPIYVGMEIDFIPNAINPTMPQFNALDYRIGSVHFLCPDPERYLFEVDGTSEAYRKGMSELFGGNARKAVELYFATTRDMVLHYPPDILGHCDKIKMNNTDNAFFSEEDTWYKAAVMETIEAIAQTKVIVEVNTRGLYKKKTASPYPSPWILREMKRQKIPIMLNSDAHHPREITGLFRQTVAMLMEIGYNELYVLTPQGLQPKPFDENGFKDFN